MTVSCASPRYRMRIGPFWPPRSASAAILVSREQMQICNVTALSKPMIYSRSRSGARRQAEVPNASGAIACKVRPQTGPASASSGGRGATNQGAGCKILECFDVVTEEHVHTGRQLPACQREVTARRKAVHKATATPLEILREMTCRRRLHLECKTAAEAPQEFPGWGQK
jgi:hypothetical protein